MLYVKIVNEKTRCKLLQIRHGLIFTQASSCGTIVLERAIVKNAAKRRLPQCSYVSPALLLSPQRCSKRVPILWSTTAAPSSLN